jgi:tetratricopeptide (TPR) repeat protein
MEDFTMKHSFCFHSLGARCFGALLAAFLFSCASGPERREDPQNLYGMIYDRDNRPVQNVSVRVNGSLRAFSDIHGHFSIPGLKPEGRYTIAAEKPQYEKQELEIIYSGSAPVLYIRLFSGDQLLAEAEGAIREKDWNRAETCLLRAEAAGAEESSRRYLEGILAFHREQYPEALEILSALAEREKTAPYLYLLMADILQYHMDRPEEARVFLRQFLNLRHDPEVRNRLRELGG